MVTTDEYQTSDHSVTAMIQVRSGSWYFLFTLKSWLSPTQRNWSWVLVPVENHGKYQETQDNAEAIFVSVFCSIISALLFRIFPSNVNIGVRPKALIRLSFLFAQLPCFISYQFWSLMKLWIKWIFYIYIISFIRGGAMALKALRSLHRPRPTPFLPLEFFVIKNSEKTWNFLLALFSS